MEKQAYLRIARYVTGNDSLRALPRVSVRTGTGAFASDGDGHARVRLACCVIARLMRGAPRSGCGGWGDAWP